MQGKSHLILSNNPAIITNTITDPPGRLLPLLQKAVGGYIEVIPGFVKFRDEECVAFCNEEGKLNGLPYNDVATMLWHGQFSFPVNDILVGNVIVITGDEEFLNGL